MARSVFPDEGSRLVFRTTGSGKPLLSAAGGVATVFTDELGSNLADIRDLGGNVITGSRLSVSAASQLPLFLGPDGVDTVWMSVDGGPISPCYARSDDRLDALATALGVDLTGVVRSVNGTTPDGGGNVVLASGAVTDATDAAKGVVQLVGDLGGTAAAPTTPTAVHKTGIETIAGLKTFSDGVVVPDASIPFAKVVTTGTKDATTVLLGTGAFTARFPLGCAENPVTDANATRPDLGTGIRVHWRTATTPLDAADGDYIDLPDGEVGTPVTPTYAEEFDTTVSGYGARTNAGSVVWDAANATRSTGGSVKWTSTLTANTIIRAGSNLAAVTGGTTYTVSIMYRNNGAAARTASVLLSYYTDLTNYVEATPNQEIGGSTSIPTGATFTEFTYTFTAPADCGAVEVCPRIDSLVDETFQVDSIRVTAT